jgi:putative endonuclease
VASEGGQAISRFPVVPALTTQDSMFYTYVLQSVAQPTQLYRGHTTDLKNRLAEHNAGKCLHTSKFTPWRIKLYAALETLDLAQHFKQYLKSGSGHAFSKGHFGL